MRALPALLLLAALAAAEEYRFEDSYFGVSYAIPNLQKGLPPSDPAVLFQGRAGEVHVEIRVHESDHEIDLAGWTKRIFGEAAEGESRRVEKRVVLEGAFEEWHAHALFARGLHCFEVHAWSDEREAARRALDGLTVGADEGAGILARRIALEKGKSPLDPAVLLEGGLEYVHGLRFRRRNLPVAAGLLARARRLARPDDLTPEQWWTLFENGGLAHAEAPEKAAEWFGLAEKAAAKLEKDAEACSAESAYNLACACSRAKRIDEAFAALHRAYAGAKPVTDAHLSSDPDLENLRRDDRWHAFWKEKVAGR